MGKRGLRLLREAYSQHEYAGIDALAARRDVDGIPVYETVEIRAGRRNRLSSEHLERRDGIWLLPGSDGAEVPFMRSPETSSDSATSWAMTDEALKNYRKLGETFDTFCLLQPTSPLRNAQDICNAYRLYEERAAIAVVSVCEAEHNPLWCGHLNASRELDGFLDKNKLTEKHGIYYRLNGAIYIVSANWFLSDKERFLYCKGSYAYVMPQERSVDIDTEFDFLQANAALTQ